MASASQHAPPRRRPRRRIADAERTGPEWASAEAPLGEYSNRILAARKEKTAIAMGREELP
jgi:hypothetical protein